MIKGTEETNEKIVINNIEYDALYIYDDRIKKLPEKGISEHIYLTIEKIVICSACKKQVYECQCLDETPEEMKEIPIEIRKYTNIPIVVKKDDWEQYSDTQKENFIKKFIV